jgi:fused signal recognition particle receptor
VRAAAAAPAAERAPRDIEGLRRGLSKARASEGFFGRLRALFSGKKELNADIARELEEVLLSSDVGSETTALLLDRVKGALSQSDLSNPDKVWETLRTEAERIVSIDGTTSPLELRGAPTVVLLVGVNGAGKTTTIGKLATKLHASGKTCVLAAGDTFRAAAVQQLVVWGGRVGCEVVRGKDGSDPSSVIFDAIKRAEQLGIDVVLADTAGRLHTKSNLMAEMKKIAKTAEKALAGAPHEILLVIDATNGQNALAQAKEFKEALPLTGIVLTKLDGTAKGGVVLGIANALRLPVRFVGLGERPDDLHEFAPADFVEALLGRDAAE